MAYKLLKGGTLVNRGKMFQADILIKDDRIERIAPSIEPIPSHQP